MSKLLNYKIDKISTKSNCIEEKPDTESEIFERQRDLALLQLEELKDKPGHNLHIRINIEKEEATEFFL